MQKSNLLHPGQADARDRLRPQPALFPPSALEQLVQLDRMEQQEFYSRLIQHLATLSGIDSATALNGWLAECLPDLFPYGILCLRGQVMSDALEAHTVLRQRYPEGAFARHFQSCSLALTPDMRQCLASGVPTFFRAKLDDFPVSAALTDRRDPHDVLVLSEFNRTTGAVVLISFSAIPPEISQENMTALRLVSAHLHAAMTRSDRIAMPRGRAAAAPILQGQMTKRESEVMHWMMQGKSNWSISIILGCGESTVKSHVKSVFAKLGVNSRVQAAQLWAELQQTK